MSHSPGPQHRVMMTLLVTIVSLLLVPRTASSPLQLEEADTTTYPPGPPEILSDLEAYDYEAYDDEEAGGDDLLYGDPSVPEDVRVEIDAFVSRSPPPENSNETEISNGEMVTEYDDIIQDLLEVKRTDSGLGLQLTWWQILLMASACVLVTGLCCYFSSCCYFTADCCSDPYWGCCMCCRLCVGPAKPPPHIGLKPRDGEQRPSEAVSKYSLNENSGAPRTRASTRSLSVSHNRGSNKSVNNITEGRSVEVQRKYSRDKTRALTSEEEERLLGDSLVAPVQASVHTLSSNRDTLTSTSGQGNTLNSVKSVRNYKRTQQRPASTLNGDPLGAKRAGLCESEPHVYKEGTGSYFSWLHLFNRSKRRYNVSRRVKKPRSQTGNGTGHVSGPGNNNIYRQTRYQHIATSRNSAVIPTKISKRASTASTYHARPMLSKRSRSAETVDSVEDVMRPMMEAVVSERHIPRSRLSANLAQLEAARTLAREVGPEYNLKYFEKSLMKSKETTI